MRLEPANIVCPKCGNGNYMRHLIGKDVGNLDMKCINCNSYFSFNELYKQKIAEVIKPQTNYDRITSSVEALAKFIVEIVDCHECEEIHGFRMCDAAPEKACEDCWAGWLRQEEAE